MKDFLKYIENENIRPGKRFRAAFAVFGLLAALAGFVLWLAVRPFALSSREWMICFIGYPVVITWFIVFIHSFF